MRFELLAALSEAQHHGLHAERQRAGFSNFSSCTDLAGRLGDDDGERLRLDFDAQLGERDFLRAVQLTAAQLELLVENRSARFEGGAAAVCPGRPAGPGRCARAVADFADGQLGVGVAIANGAGRCARRMAKAPCQEDAEGQRNGRVRVMVIFPRF